MIKSDTTQYINMQLQLCIVALTRVTTVHAYNIYYNQSLSITTCTDSIVIDELTFLPVHHAH